MKHPVFTPTNRNVSNLIPTRCKDNFDFMPPSSCVPYSFDFWYSWTDHLVRDFLLIFGVCMSVCLYRLL
jgi:hypothetical protein